MQKDTQKTDRFFAIVNPAAGGGRSAKLARPALARLRAAGLEVDVVSTTAPGDAVRHVEFNMPDAVDVMVDGEVLPLKCRTLDIVPAAVDVYI